MGSRKQHGDACAALEGLTSADTSQRVPSLHRLVAALDSAYGAESVAICAAVREVPGVLAALVKFLEADPDDTGSTADACSVIANICSDEVDPQSAVTKRQLLAHPGAAESIFW